MIALTIQVCDYTFNSITTHSLEDTHLLMLDTTHTHEYLHRHEVMVQEEASDNNLHMGLHLRAYLRVRPT